MNLKLLLGMILIGALLSLDASAEDEFSKPAIWKQLVSCDNGAAVVDVDIQDRGPFHTGKAKQIVVRDANIVNYLKSRGLTVNIANEVIARVYGYDIDLKGTQSAWKYGDHLNTYFTSNNGNGFRLYFEGYVLPQTDGDGFYHVGRKYEVANWNFQKCN